MSADTHKSNLSQPVGVGLSIEPAGGLDIDAQQVDHLLIMKSFADDLELAATVNRLAPTQMEVKPGTIVLGLVLDTLSRRSPLYRLVEFFEGRDTEVLLASVFRRASSPMTRWVEFWIFFLRRERNGSFPSWP